MGLRPFKIFYFLQCGDQLSCFSDVNIKAASSLIEYYVPDMTYALTGTADDVHKISFYPKIITLKTNDKAIPIDTYTLFRMIFKGTGPG